MNSSLLRYGSPRSLLPLQMLRAGPLTLQFDPNLGCLQQIRLGDHEVLRRIFAAVRDHEWATIPSAVSNLKAEIGPDSFRLSFDVECRQGVVDYQWHGTITGEKSGQIAFGFDGVSRSHFQRNRLGICVLHPIVECAGKPFTVEHWDGRTEAGTFPRFIAPQQPCFDIRGFTHEVAPGVRAELRFDGEAFEMEDQRNFADVSFKIYSTPQSRPKPVAVAPGDKVQQQVTLRLHMTGKPVLPVVQGRAPQLSITTTPVHTLPPLGFSAESHGRPLTAREIERLKRLRPAHLRVDLKLAKPGWQEALRLAASEAAQLGAGLYVAFTVTAQAGSELKALAAAAANLPARVALWIVGHESESPPTDAWVRLAREILQPVAPGVLFATGPRIFFYELNNNRPAPESFALPCVPTNPQIHLTDHGTLVENVPGAAALVESAREFSPKPVVISPFTLRGPYHPGPFPVHFTADDLPPEVDPRQFSLFGAGWTLASLARLAATGNVHGVTCFETTGWRGVMESEAGSPLPEKFPSIPGAVFPIYHLLADLAEFPARQIYGTLSSHPAAVEGLTLFDGSGRRRILVANLVDEPLDVKIKTGTCQARVRYLDETNAESAMRDPESFRAQSGAAVESVSGKIELKLLPCALARVDIG